MHARLQSRIEAVEVDLATVREELATAEDAALVAKDAATVADRQARLALHRLAVLRAKRVELERVVAAGHKALATVDHA